MKIAYKAAWTLALFWSGVSMVMAQNTAAAPKSEPVKDALPKAVITPQMEAFKKQLSSVIVFRDPATGQFQTPDPGQVRALQGNGAGAARTMAPASGRLPNGGRFLQSDPSKLRLMTVKKNAAGSLSYDCALPGQKQAVQPEGHNEK